MGVKKQKKKVLYDVQCVHDEKHVFEKVFEIETGAEEKEETGVETYCPYCNKIVKVTVKEKSPLNEKIIKRFQEQDKRLERK